MPKISDGKIVERLRRQREELAKQADAIRIKLEALDEALGVRDRKGAGTTFMRWEGPLLEMTRFDPSVTIKQPKPEGFKLIPEMIGVLAEAENMRMSVREIGDKIEKKWRYRPASPIIRSTAKYVQERGGPLEKLQDGTIRLNNDRTDR